MKFEARAGADFELVHAARAGDVSAFDELVRRHTQRMFRVALHITNCVEDAEEVVQDSFVKAFKNLDRFEERAQFSTWLTRIAVNTALMKVRARSKHKTVSLTHDEPEGTDAAREYILDWHPNPEQLYSQLELKEILIKALDSLPDHYRTIFLLRDIEGFSIEETAELLDLNAAAVKARLMRARLALRERLSVHFQCGRRPAQTAAPREGLPRTVTSSAEPGVELWMQVAAARASC